jgi:hypothetical protein
MPYESINDMYDVFLAITYMDENWSQVTGTQNINMIDCRSIDHPKFEKGSIYYDFFNSRSRDENPI